MEADKRNDMPETPAETPATAPNAQSINPQTSETWANPTAPSSSTPVTFGAAPTATVQQHGNFLWTNKLLTLAFITYGVNLAALLIAYATNEYDIAANMAGITFYGGILGAVFLGAGMVQATLNSITRHGGSVNGMLRLGILLLVLSILFGLITLIPGLILLVVGTRRPPTSATPMSDGKKAALAIATFIGGGVTGLIVSTVIYLMTSDRACQLSSSKCY